MQGRSGCTYAWDDVLRRFGAKVDGNQEAIVDALRTAGCSVQSLSRVGDGAPDLLVGRARVNFLLEVKRPHASGKRGGPLVDARAELSLEQEAWHRLWRGSVSVVRSPEDALNAVGLGSSCLALVRDMDDERTVLIRRPRRPRR